MTGVIDMIEIRIPKEIKNYREKRTMGAASGGSIAYEKTENDYGRSLRVVPYRYGDMFGYLHNLQIC